MATPAPANSQAGNRLFAVRSAVYMLALIGLVVIAAGAGAMVWTYSQRARTETTEDVALTPVFRGLYEHIILEQGQVESEINVELRCEVKSRSPGGTKIALFTINRQFTIVYGWITAQLTREPSWVAADDPMPSAPFS